MSEEQHAVEDQDGDVADIASVQVDEDELPENRTAVMSNAPARAVAVALPEEPCHALMTRMLRDRRHLAIVRGGNGETLGLVTLEDLVEEFVGDIHDEHDDVQGDR